MTNITGDFVQKPTASNVFFILRMCCSRYPVTAFMEEILDGK